MAEKIGETRNVVVEIHCDRDLAEWIASHLPQSDRFVRDLWEALEREERHDGWH